MSREELEYKIKPKEDFELVFGIQGRQIIKIEGFFIPNRRELTVKFLVDVLSGSNKPIKTSRITTYVVLLKFDGVRIETCLQNRRQTLNGLSNFQNIFDIRPISLNFTRYNDLI